ncbi:DENN domain-containing protein 1B isoform X2 [Cololabis saira]|uniref:DENN domain-containing protein 1B isoform X2 n=1 Tax=Cololabis saira TaxID=129043 RepID=UPI002AD24D39|nr:DENN domain-containing protein 1B isoform X2 [Cololabis saira]
MGSRLKKNPERTFNWFFEATCPVARDKDPGVQFQFPEDFSDEDSCHTLPRFCFPYDIHRSRDTVAVQHFTFVLTDLEGCQRFGFCRLTNSTQVCLCILSYLPWFEVFYKLLNNLADYLSKGQISEMKALLAALYQQPIPLPAGSVTLQMGEQLLVSTEVFHPVGHPETQEGIPYFIAPDQRSLPTIPENRNLTELIVAVDVGNLLHLYASMLFERRILIFASKLSTLTSCVHALSAVLYPMYWQHIFIPVLPPHLLDYCCAPMPYLIGVHTSLSEKVRSRGLEEVVILNVDTNTLENPFDDLKRIPSDVVSGLKMCLKRQAVSPGCGVSLAFLKAQALLFGGYRDALQCHQESEIYFCEELFLDHKSTSMKQFLESAVHLQFFKQFIDSRLDILNKGKEPDDLFEDEIKCGTTAGRSKSYQQLVGNLKKGGGALILNMKTKANMKAKGLTKSGLKNLLIHKANSEKQALQRGGSVSHRRARSDCLQNRLPITQHFGSRPRRPVQNLGDQENARDTADGWDRAVSESVAKPDSELQKDEEEGDDSPLCDPEEMDLLGEIFDTLSSRSSHERGLLYATRSLDLFGADSHDYIMKRGPENPSQESLFMSISGSGSLHSWNLETTEELSHLTEDSDPLDTSLPEEQGTDSLEAACDVKDQEKQHEDIEKHKEINMAINGEQEEEEKYIKNSVNEVKLEGERMKDQENNTVLDEDPSKQICETREDDKLTDKSGDDRSECEEVALGQETEGKTNEMEDSVTREEIQDEKKEMVKTDLNKCIKLNSHHPNSVEEQQSQGETPSNPGPQDPAEDLKYPAEKDEISEKAAENKEQEKRQAFSPPKVQSAAARFQPRPTPKLSVDSVLLQKGNAQTHSPSVSDINESSDTPEEQDCTPVKVSELKKRFET